MKKIKLKTSKGELIALMEITSVYYGQRHTMEKDDKAYIMVSFLLSMLVKRIVLRLHKIADEPETKMLKISLHRAEGFALLVVLKLMDTYQLPWSPYIINVMNTLIINLDQALA